MTELTIVAPVYNEEASIEEFHRRLTETLKKTGLSSEIVYVNDGSSDRSHALLKTFRAADPSVKILEFSRNFGHQIAVKAGIDHAEGNIVVVIDTDLQDPPEAILDLLTKHREGFDVVYAVRAKRDGESLFKRWTSAAYYRLMRKLAHVDIPLDAGDFRLMSGEVAQALRQINEKNPYIRGLVSWVGFRQTGVAIHRQARFAGKTKYSLKKMFQLAWNGITHFSFLPLQISTWVGAIASLVCFVWMLSALYVHFVLHIAVPGWTSIMVAVLFLGSVQLLTLGIMGSYLAKNYDQTRSRPLYILKNKESR